MNPELEAFIPLFPPADLTDPVTARKNLAALSATAQVPDTTGMEIEDRTVPADPDVPPAVNTPGSDPRRIAKSLTVTDFGGLWFAVFCQSGRRIVTGVGTHCHQTT